MEKNKSLQIQSVSLPHHDIHLDILRADENHPHISGNKLWKLQYNIQEAVKNQKDTLLSFGGAYSNHIYALAYAAFENRLNSIGIIRGDELKYKSLNPSLRKAHDLGMKLYFLSRSEYQRKEQAQAVQKILNSHSSIFVIPEGGSNSNAIMGVKEAVSPYVKDYNYISCAVGTGGTIAGILEASDSNQTIIGFPALKNGSFLKNDIQKFTSKDNFKLDLRYHFGGYGKYNSELTLFIEKFYQQHQIPLDLIYTGKMIYGLLRNIEAHEYPKGSRILAIHTGGLQGNQGKINFNINSN